MEHDRSIAACAQALSNPIKPLSILLQWDDSFSSIFAKAAKCEPDSQGRILIPAKLRTYAMLEREVFINGMSKCLELWNPERWEQIESDGLLFENLAANMEELGI